MKDVFEKVSKAYEGAKESVKNKLENFKKKFGETKNEMSQEVMKAETPEDLIALGEKLKQQGETLKAEKGGIEKEEEEKGKLEAEKSGMIESDHGEALEEDKAFDEAKATKAAEEEAKRKAEIVELDRLQTEEDAKKAAEILANIKGTGGESAKMEGQNKTRKTAENKGENQSEGIEDIYGMNKEDAEELLQSKGYLAEGEIKTSDPKFKEKLEEFHNRRKRYDQVETKLFNRVVSGVAAEEEINMAEEQVADLAKKNGLRGFKFIPKACYANERLTNAMIVASSGSSDNKEWINYVKENYTEEELKNS